MGHPSNLRNPQRKISQQRSLRKSKKTYLLGGKKKNKLEEMVIYWELERERN